MIQKLNPRTLQRVDNRLQSLKSISDALDLGNGKTVVIFETSIDEYRSDLNAYNSNKSTLDGQRVALLLKERALLDLNEAMLLSVAVKYGKNSPEYVKAGGVQKSNRKRPNRSSSATVSQS